MKAMTPQQRARNKKRAKGWVPYEAWVHHSNYDKLVAAIKAWQAPATKMVTNGYFRLTPNQRRFERLLTEYPVLYSYWDFDKRDCDIKTLNKAMGALSSGEQIMAAFFMAVWTGNSDTSFNIVDAGALDDDHRRVIADWLLDPFYP